MSDDADKAAGTTGHEWDGIRELDNPLPRWWLWVFFITIAFSIVYWILMPAWPGLTGHTRGLLHQSDRADVTRALADLKTKRGVEGQKLAAASLEEIERDPAMQAYALAVGQSVFGDNCATCHGADGQGGKGYANLRDDIWLWGGSLDHIYHTISTGIRSTDSDQASQMPAFGRDKMLKPAEIDDLTQYVVQLSGRTADAAAVTRAAPLFDAQCAACHGPDGKGQQLIGAPNLTDSEWLYGSTPAAIHDQIWNGHGGAMPPWKDRLDEPTRKALAVYVHVNAGSR